MLENYKIAVEHNSKHYDDLLGCFRDPYVRKDRWVMHKDGRIGFLKCANVESCLIIYPIQMLKTSFRCFLGTMTHEEFKEALERFKQEVAHG